MRLATDEYRGRRHRGVVDGAAVRPFPGGTTLPGLIRSGGLSGPATGLPPLGDPVAVNGVRPLLPERLGRRLLEREDRTEAGTRSERLDASVGDDARGLPAVGRTSTLTYGADSGRCRGLEGLWELTVLAESFVPPPRVAVLATVGLAAPVAQPGDFLGCRASVCGARPVAAAADRFLGAHEVVVEWAGTAASRAKPRRATWTAVRSSPRSPTTPGSTPRCPSPPGCRVRSAWISASAPRGRPPVRSRQRAPASSRSRDVNIMGVPAVVSLPAGRADAARAVAHGPKEQRRAAHEFFTRTEPGYVRASGAAR